MLLLPPSEGKAPGGDGPPWADGPRAFPALNRRRVRVRNAVRRALRAAPDGGERLLGARGPTLERSRAEWKELDSAPTLPAWRRYSGVVWEALSPATLSPAGAAGLRERVLVPSGLWGLLAATDPVPPYRLRMAARVEPLGTLARFWRDPVTAALSERAGAGWIVDLLPGEHSAAVDAGGLRGARLVRVELVTGGARRAAGHAGKHAKGLLARAVLETGARAPDEVAALDVVGLRTIEVRAETPHHVVVMQLT